MQYFDRRLVPPPEFLRSSRARQAREELLRYMSLEREELRQTKARNLQLDVGTDVTVRRALRRLFHEKCAFCEGRTEIHVLRFRPASDAWPVISRSDGHLYYLWLSNAWENLYPACKACSTSDPKAFPVDGPRCPLPSRARLEAYVRADNGLWGDHAPAETSMLLDPCVDHGFEDHFDVLVSGEIRGRTPRATATIDMFNLNRRDLIQDRATRFKDYLRRLVEELDPGGHAAQADVFQFADMEFGGVWYLLLRRIAARAAGDAATPETLSQRRIGALLRRRSRTPERWARFQTVIDEFRSERLMPVWMPSRPPQPPAAPRSKATLRSVRLGNFKGLEDLSLTMPPAQPRPAGEGDPDAPPPAPALLILGENAAGKSSILEAVALALCDPETRGKLGSQPARILLDPRLMGRRRGRPRKKGSVDVVFDDASHRTLAITPDGFTDHAGPTRPPLVFAYGAFRQYLPGHEEPQPIRTLFETDTILPNPERWLLGLDRDTFREAGRVLRDVLSIEASYKYLEADQAGGRCLIRFAAPGGGEYEMPLTHASSGYRTVLAMVCDLMRGLMDRDLNPDFRTLIDARAIVLIDEIEAHLHPRWKMQIMRALRTAFPQVTFIATTHDPLCLRGMQDGEVAVLHRVTSEAVAGRGLPVVIERLSDLPPFNHLTIEQLLTSDFFSLFSTDAPLIERRMAEVADLLAKRGRGEALSGADETVLAAFEAEVSDALPVGSTEVRRLVQEAVADYLRDKRKATDERLQALRGETKMRILAALERVA